MQPLSFQLLFISIYCITDATIFQGKCNKKDNGLFFILGLNLEPNYKCGSNGKEGWEGEGWERVNEGGDTEKRSDATKIGEG